MTAEDKIEKALIVALGYGAIDGADHKAWVIDKMVRILTGDKYDEFIREHAEGEDGPNTYEWDVGVAP